MQQGKARTLDSGSARGMQSFQSSSRRTGDVEVLNKMPKLGQRNRQLLLSNNSSDLESSQLRIGTSCEDDRPNNWQDCYTWPASLVHKVGQQSTNSDGYDKWARHADQRSPRDRSKTNNIADPSAVPSPRAVQNKMSAFVKHQHLPAKQTLQAETASGGGGSMAAGRDGPSGPRYSRPESGSQVTEERTRLSQIWTALSDLLPQTQVSLDKMDSSEIVSQVMKIRDSLKSASSLLIALGKQPDSETTRLQRDYLDAIFELLHKQETCYLIALQRALVTSEDGHSQHDMAEPMSPKSDSKSEEPTELEISESSNDELENPTGGAAGDAEFPLNNQRPIIEDHLGDYSDSDLDELQQKLNSLNDAPWPGSLALQRVPSCTSSHRSPRSPLVKGRSSAGQKFHSDCLPAGSEPPSQPCHPSKNTFQRDGNLEGSDVQGPSTASTRAAAPYPVARVQVKGQFGDKLADSAAGIYGAVPSDVDNDVLEDLSQLMKKKQELESFLAERNRQLRDLQQHHDLLKELLQQQEENAALLQGLDEEQPAVWNTDHLNSSPRMEENLTSMPSPRTKHTMAAAAGSQLSPASGPTSLKPVSHQKNLLKESSRLKSDAKDSTKFKDGKRTCKNEDRKMPVLSSRLGVPKDKPAKPSADWSAMLALSDSSRLFADCDHTRRKNVDEEDSSAMNPNQVEKRHCQKSRVDFELGDETALAGDADDPNSSLALRDEPQHTKGGSEDDYMSEFCNTVVPSYEETGACGNYENSLQPLNSPSEKSILMLQQNMSKLLEAKKELEALRNLLHFGTQERPRETRPAHESGQRNDQSDDQPLREPRTGGAIAAYDQTGTHSEMMRLKLLKVANEKLDRLKLVMDDVQRSPGVASMASLPFDRTNPADGASATKASNTPTFSNFTLRNMQVSDLSSADRSRSQQTVDVLDDRLNASGLDRLLQLLSSEKPQCNDGASPVPPAKAPYQSAMKEGFFIRNSLPESVSSRGTSQPPSDNRGGMETNSQCPKGDRKGASKNSSTTNISNASCVPCISLSADCIPLETGYQNTVSTLMQQDKNSKKPCKVIRNQHVEFQHTHVSEPSTTFPRNSSQGVNIGKKHVAVNTEKMKHRNSEDDAIEMKTELKNISQELKVLRQEVTLLTRTISQNVASDRPAVETRGDVLDPKLLVGLNQSFQQLMAENRRLSDRFTQLHDFVLRRTTRNQHTFESCNESVFNRNVEVDSEEQGCSHNRPSSFGLACDDPDIRSREQDETWVKSPHRLGAREVRFSGNQSLKRRPEHLLTYLENDLNPQHCQPQSRENFYGQGICGDNFSTNSNGNNSRSNIIKNRATAALLQEDNVSCHSTCALHPHSSGRGVSSPASGSPARSLSSGNPANYLDNRFNAMKETIYSEVAVFIAKHENRPYYLLELIRELQKLKTDTLRQQAVDSFDRIISKYLTNDEFQMQVNDEIQVKQETVEEEAQLHCDSSHLYTSAVSGFSCFQGANSSSISGDIAEDEVSEEEEQEGEDADRGITSCCTDPDNVEGKEDKTLVDGGTEEEDEEQDEDGSSSHSSGNGDDSCSTDPDRLEDDACMERGLESAEREALDEGGKCSPSSMDDVRYSPDFKSETSSSSPETEAEAADVTLGSAAEVAKPTDSAMPAQNLDAVAEQMGFVTVEFVNAPSGGRINSENEKGSSASDESWEKAEIPEKDHELRPAESDTSEDIIEEIIVEDCGSSGSVEELTLDQLHQKLTSISKEEIARRMVLECQGELSAQQILETIGTDTQSELAGDPVAIKQPASPFDKDESRHV